MVDLRAIASLTTLVLCAVALTGVGDVHAQEATAGQSAQAQAPARREPTSAELSKNETVGTALMRTFGS
jgi:hypothetical protein